MIYKDIMIILKMYLLMISKKKKSSSRTSMHTLISRFNFGRRLIGVEHLDCESAFFWQHLVEYLSRNNEHSEKLDAILPELVDLVDVIYE